MLELHNLHNRRVEQTAVSYCLQVSYGDSVRLEIYREPCMHDDGPQVRVALFASDESVYDFSVDFTLS